MDDIDQVLKDFFCSFEQKNYTKEKYEQIRQKEWEEDIAYYSNRNEKGYAIS